MSVLLPLTFTWQTAGQAPVVHRVAALIKRWILGTHHGSVQPAHLDAYLDEFVFRFNRRTSASRGCPWFVIQQLHVPDEILQALKKKSLKPTSASRTAPS